MAWVSVATIGSAAIGYMGQQNAASSAQGASQQNIQAQQQWNQQQDPFSAGGNRAQYAPQLNQLMQGGYQGIQNDPMYKWQQQQGQQELQAGMAKSGKTGSGQEMMALQQQGFGMAGDFFNQQYNRLSDLSGANRGGGQSTASMGQTPGAMYQQGADQGQQIGNIFGAGVGAARQGGFGSGGGGGGASNVDQMGMPINPPSP